MSSPDYINWPTNGPWFQYDHPLARGCVAAWCLNPTWQGQLTCYDMSRYGEHGTLVNLPTTHWTPRGLYLDATNDERVDTTVYPSSDIVGMTMFVQWHDLGVQGLCGAHDRNDHRFYLGIDLDDIYVGYGTAFKSDTDHKLTVNQWAHMALMYDGTNANVYIDGRLRQSFAATFAGAATQGMMIGARNDNTDPDTECDATFSTVKIYDRCLSQDEVRQLAADPFCIFRQRETAYFFGGTSLPPTYIPYPFSRGARGGLHALSGGNAA